MQNEPRQDPPAWVKLITATHLTSSERLFLLAVLWHQGRNDSAWARQDKYAADIGTTGRTIRRLAESLSHKGWLAAERQGKLVRYSPILPEGKRTPTSGLKDAQSGHPRPVSAPKADTRVRLKRTPVSGDNRTHTKNTAKKRGVQRGDSCAREIFDHWNMYQGRSTEKDGRLISWHGHRPKPDGGLAPDIIAGCKSALADYTVEEIKGAIDNYALVLLSPEYFWSYAWSLPEFLTRRQGRQIGALRQLCRFLPDNFDAANYVSRQTQDDDRPPSIEDITGCHPCDEDEARRLLQEAGLWEGDETP